MVLVYLATNTTNGKRYIGQTSQKFRRRKYAHMNDARTGRSKTIFGKALLKYAEDCWSWKIIAECADTATANWLEETLIHAMGTLYTEWGYNQCLGGKSRRGFVHTEATKKKMRGRETWNKGKKTGPSWNKGKSGWTIPIEKQQYMREKVSKQMENNQYASGNTNNRKSVRCIDTGDVFPSLYHASEWVRGIFNRSQISAVCNGHRKTAYGYRWEFVCQQ